MTHRGHDDTSAAVEDMTKYLADRDLVAIFLIPEARFAPILFCYPAKSRSFGFLNGSSNTSQGESLRLAGWNGAFSLYKFNAARLRPAGSARDTSTPQRPERPERQERFDEKVGSGMVGFLASKGSLRIDTSTPNKEPQPRSLESRDIPTGPKNSHPNRSRPLQWSGAEGPSSNKEPQTPSRGQSSDTPTGPKNSYPNGVRPQVQPGEGPSLNKGPQQTSSMVPSTVNPSNIKGLPPRPPSSVHSGDLSSAQNSSLPGQKDPSSVKGLPPLPPSIQSQDLSKDSTSNRESVPNRKESSNIEWKDPSSVQELPPRPPSVQPRDLSREEDSASRESVPSRLDSSNIEELQPNKEPQPTSDRPNDPSGDVKMTDVSNDSSLPQDVDLDAYFKEHYKITFDELTSVAGPRKANIFFLWFPDEAHDECQLLKVFLDKHLVVVLSNREGDMGWERFVKNEVGVALVCYFSAAGFADAVQKKLTPCHSSIRAFTITRTSPL